MSRPATHGSFRGRALQNDDVLNFVTGIVQRLIDDLFEASILTLAIGHVSGEDQSRAARLNAVAQRLRAEPRKHDGVDRADADRRQHQNDRLRTGRHVHREAITLLDAHSAQRRRHALYFVEQMRIGINAALAAFVEVDQGGVSAPAALNVIIERVVAPGSSARRRTT